MRPLWIAGLGAGLLALGGCGGKSVCEQVADEKKAVLDSYCAGKDEVCWYCKCHNRAEQLKTTVTGEAVVFSCVPVPAKGEDPQLCEGIAQEEDQACLDQKPSCIVDAATLQATSKCGISKP